VRAGPAAHGARALLWRADKCAHTQTHTHAHTHARTHAGPAAHGASSALESSAGGGCGDGVLMRIMSIAKGRALVARALRTLLVPPVPYLTEPGARATRGWVR